MAEGPLHPPHDGPTIMGRLPATNLGCLTAIEKTGLSNPSPSLHASGHSRLCAPALRCRDTAGKKVLFGGPLKTNGRPFSWTRGKASRRWPPSLEKSKFEKGGAENSMRSGRGVQIPPLELTSKKGLRQQGVRTVNFTTSMRFPPNTHTHTHTPKTPAPSPPAPSRVDTQTVSLLLSPFAHHSFSFIPLLYVRLPLPPPTLSIPFSQGILFEFYPCDARAPA